MAGTVSTPIVRTPSYAIALTTHASLTIATNSNASILHLVLTCGLSSAQEARRFSKTTAHKTFLLVHPLKGRCFTVLSLLVMQSAVSLLNWRLLECKERAMGFKQTCLYSFLIYMCGQCWHCLTHGLIRQQVFSIHKSKLYKKTGK